MIAQILNREFVLGQLAQICRELQPVAGDRRQPAEVDADVAQLILAASAQERLKSSGQQGYDDRGNAAGAAAWNPIDDRVFLSHDPIISNVQSALDRALRDSLPPAEPNDDDRRGGGPAVSDAPDPIGATVLPGAAAVDSGHDRRLFGAFEQTDPRWVASLIAEGVRTFTGRHPFNPNPAGPYHLGNRCRLVLVGDWGTGLPRAIQVGAAMRSILRQGQAAGLEQHVIHLGDVYYSGWPDEYRENFLPHWPVRPDEIGPALTSWSLNGNHDMYSGGYGYYDCLLNDPRFARQQKSSFFSFHNDSWDIFALDTAYEDEGLADPQLDWIRSTRRPNRRSMLLSHHQLFSAYESPCVPLANRIQPLLNANPVDVWFWGHEHRCVFYRPESGVKRARLIGHGGVPVYMPRDLTDAYRDPAVYEFRGCLEGLIERWALFGFAVVDLAGERAHARYINEFGSLYREEDL